MQRIRMQGAAALLVAGLLGGACARYHESSAAGEVISAQEAAETVVLHVENLGMSTIELRSIVDGRSRFLGAVSAHDTSSIPMDRTLFPTANLFIAAFAQAGGQRVVVGPLAAGPGESIDLTVQEGLTGSQARVRR
ncbi:MAG TPA: hypothetical protein VGQ44_12610 [Gemmatimonadaceae bacterium]|nr:hypothetical protein [Gemmatimonadaceae bacterium]